MTYRSDTDALEARLEVIEKDLAERTRERDDIARMVAEARDRDAAQRWLDQRPARRRRRIVLVGLASVMMMVGGIVTFAVLRHDGTRAHEEKIVGAFEGFTLDMCGCTDARCAHGVNDRFTEWAAQMAKDEHRYDKPDEHLIKRVTEIATRYSECMTKAMSSETVLESGNH